MLCDASPLLDSDLGQAGTLPSSMLSGPSLCISYSEAVQVIVPASTHNERAKRSWGREHLTLEPACCEHPALPGVLHTYHSDCPIARTAGGSAAPHARLCSKHRAAANLTPGRQAHAGSRAGAIVVHCRLHPQEPAGGAIEAVQAPVLAPQQDLSAGVRLAHHARRRVDCSSQGALPQHLACARHTPADLHGTLFAHRTVPSCLPGKLLVL